jgi:hypothetical protein
MDCILEWLQQHATQIPASSITLARFIFSNWFIWRYILDNDCGKLSRKFLLLAVKGEMNFEMLHCMMAIDVSLCAVSLRALWLLRKFCNFCAYQKHN